MMIMVGNGDGLRGRSEVLMKVAQRGYSEILEKLPGSFHFGMLSIPKNFHGPWR